MKSLTAEWVKKAEADFVAAGRLAGASVPLHDQVCFHGQQSAEKYLKALLQELGLTVPKVHDLDHLLALLLPHHAGLRVLRRGLVFLSDFAVDPRYPGATASRRQARAALRWAERVRAACRKLLGIRSRPPKKPP